MIKKTLYRLAGVLTPNLRRRFSERALVREAERLATLGEHEEDIGRLVDAVLRSQRFAPLQIPQEISRLLERVRDLNPLRLCEIGCYRGGTLFLFAHMASPGARILSMDLRYPASRVAANTRLCRRPVEMTCLRGDSHESTTRDAVRQWLVGDDLDVLFIDGDHSYNGVRQDFEMYSPFVRPGGLIAFHDIVPDWRTRHGKPTRSFVGEVPRFWNEVKTQFRDSAEFIADPDQDGYGIGLLTVPH